MTSTVFDLPAVVNVADHFRPSMEECPNRDNVKFVPGDFFKDDLPPADLHSLVTILHDWDEEKIDCLLNKIYNSLPSGKKNNTDTCCPNVSYLIFSCQILIIRI